MRMRKAYQQPQAFVEAVCLGDAINISVSGGQDTDQQLVKGVFDAEDASDKDDSDWAEAW